MQVFTSAESDPSVSMIIPVYNGGEKFLRCLASVQAAAPAADEIIVVADGGTAHTPCLDTMSDIVVLETRTQGGPGKARNLGAAQARGDILFFVDADVTIEPDTIGKLREIFRNRPDVAALFGSYDDAPSEDNFLSQYRNLLHHYVHQNAREEASTFWGACGAIRRDIFRDLGGFDEKKYDRPCIEDIELGYRVKLAGHRILLYKSLQIKHLKKWDMHSIIKTDFFQRALPWTELLLNNRQFMNDLNVDTANRLSVAGIMGLLLALVLSTWQSAFLGLALIFSLILLYLNRPLYDFFRRKRGFWFALKTIPWHWLYFFYSGLAFAVGLTRHYLSRANG
ncbi:MAG: glycosyltransferase [Calditrichaeota bacterium]|nr:glycosyltransferase [Calditrichota bacterium]